ncbi:hypothetical protein KNT80_gp18 [Vibrio phage 1.245.O._10N.261.54.C7]|uniref:Coil containing protein n=1 Tax=Vibrio phage 1.245.O._10N.261.54.C7 TaxID=1881236 RepID=A0A2I7RWJ5_9CAUD|nr:hypothetical protein KNT80_gp18 [Vibrio phage 1.245.O._10N.261.54.C7]AUR97931.1 hypothetical protein NVP1245O_18 [Vibrio phage 1.245.O._10N.261.54.C7]
MATIEDLANQVGELTDATTDLLTEVNGQKGRLENLADGAQDSANDAQSHANASAGSAIDSSNYANDSAGSAQQSATSAAEAKTYRDQAEEISGLDTVEEAVDLALDARHFGVLSEAEAEAIRADNEEECAASGFVHFGKAPYSTGNDRRTPINEGLSAPFVSDLTNRLLLGINENHSSAGIRGNSKTIRPFVNIAGITTELTHINNNGTSTYNGSNYIYFPPAPNGTVTYDSATGVITDFTKEVDNKYGDVAADLNEAVARAFEGDCRNGDFRNGTTDWSGSGTTISASANELTLTADSGIGSRYATSARNEFWDIGDVVKVKLDILRVGSTGTLLAYWWGQTDATQSVEATPDEWYTMEFTFTVDNVSSNSTKNLYAGTSSNIPEGGQIKIRNVSYTKVTNEVVTERVDMWGFEQWHEEVTDGEVFDCVQSRATTFGDTDVPTVLSKRPLSYFQVYDGQFEDPSAINDQYRCVDWNAITDVQKKKVAAYLKEKLFVGENGNLVNVRIRQRTIAGAGNGDWRNIDSIGSGSTSISFDGKYLAAQGVLDSKATFANGTGCYFSNGAPYEVKSLAETGVFVVNGGGGSATPNTSVAYKGECYFLVCGTVPRLNQGMYVVGLNEHGSVADVSGKKWYETSEEFNTLADCFNQEKISHD